MKNKYLKFNICLILLLVLGASTSFLSVIAGSVSGLRVALEAEKNRGVTVLSLDQNDPTVAVCASDMTSSLDNYVDVVKNPIYSIKDLVNSITYTDEEFVVIIGHSGTNGITMNNKLVSWDVISTIAEENIDKKFIIPTAGNAGAALAAYTARVGGEAFVIMPQDTPKFLQTEVKALGGKIKLVPGTIKDAALYVKEIAHEQNYFDVSTLKEPYRVEGKKTMAYEIVEQLNWGLPDIIIYPTGGGTGIVGMWKAFKEMEELKLIGSKKPKIVSVQSSGCAPIVKAFDEKKSRADFWDYASTIAPGLRVPNAIGDYLILQAIYESKGTAIAVTDEDILLAMKKIAKQEGIMLAPEAAAPFASLTQLRESGFITQGQSMILFGTGSGLLYPELW